MFMVQAMGAGAHLDTVGKLKPFPKDAANTVDGRNPALSKTGIMIAP